MRKTILLPSIILASVLLFGCQNTEEPSQFSIVPEITITSKDKIFFEKIGNNYDEITIEEEINGKIVIRGDNVISTDPYDEEYYIVYDNKEFGPYTNVSDLTKFKDGIAFFAKKDGKSYIITDKTQTKLTSNFAQISYLKEVAGKFTFKVDKYTDWDGPVGTIYTRLFHDFKEIGKEYDSVDNLDKIDGKLYYTAEKNSETFIVNLEDESPIKTNLNEIISIIKYNDELSYYGKKDNKVFIVIGEKTFGPFDSIEDIYHLSKDKSALIFATKNSNNEVYLQYHDQNIGPYDRIERPVDFDEHVIYKFTSTENETSTQHLFVDGKILGPYKKIDNIKKDGDDLFFTTKESSSQPYKLHRASDDKIIAESIYTPPSTIDGKIITEKHFYEDKYSMGPSRKEFYIDGVNMSEKYKNEFQSLIYTNINNKLVLQGEKENDDNFYHIIDNTEYGPFPTYKRSFHIKDNYFILLENKEGQEELYMAEV
ncbi:hypothetical protein HOF67_02005 [Candidatus Peregrinibacteria bacterium]|jgi:hypothetical protein|nr:hypothetical protein [Candidatus Peregrinibacteria bacterium]